MRILAFVLAGGEGVRLLPLTARHAKPALPFVNGYRIIDFVLSNMINSGIYSIVVLAQHRPRSLIDHLRTTWSPRLTGEDSFLQVIYPDLAKGAKPLKGTADAVFQNLDLVERHAPELVAVFAADHVYRMDIRHMAAFHRANNADVTVAAISVPVQTASAFGVIRARADGRILEFREKPLQPAAMVSDPTRAYVSMGNYLFSPHFLAGVLAEVNSYDRNDFGYHIMPRLPGRCRLFAYDFFTNSLPGQRAHEKDLYWRDVGTREALIAARNDARGPRPLFSLHNDAWPIFKTDWSNLNMTPDKPSKKSHKQSIKASSAKPANLPRARNVEKRAAPGADAQTTGEQPRFQGITVTPEERYKMIASRAFLRAEKRHFVPGHEIDDWLCAEAEVDQMLFRGEPQKANPS